MGTWRAKRRRAVLTVLATVLSLDAPSWWWPDAARGINDPMMHRVATVRGVGPSWSVKPDG